MHIAGFFRSTRLTFVKKQHESGDVHTFYFSSRKPIKHIAGQHGLFLLPKLPGVRIFSLSSAPEEKYVAISTHVGTSKYKQRLAALQPNDTMLLIGPALDFIFKKDTSEYVFLAQGIGITPFRSMLLHAKKVRLSTETTLIHVDKQTHTFRDETQKLASHAYYPSSSEEFKKAVEKTLNTNAAYYLSGSPKFVRTTKRTLKGLGVKSIRSDTFLGY